MDCIKEIIKHGFDVRIYPGPSEGYEFTVVISIDLPTPAWGMSWSWSHNDLELLLKEALGEVESHLEFIKTYEKE